jgi:hypothetical protein
MNRYCRHNLRYWDLQPYLGLGPSAAGTAVQDNHLIRFRGFEDTGTYAESSAFSQYEREDLNKKEELEEYLIVALRTRWGFEGTVLRSIRNGFRHDFCQSCYRNKEIRKIVDRRFAFRMFPNRVWVDGYATDSARIGCMYRKRLKYRHQSFFRCGGIACVKAYGFSSYSSYY